ncbi:30S ribosomal protein S17 [Algihabitans albus]|uniref:30S ribosomal protein S17 n=1 Tax=Algihabitans albus TaxID=2164067 RepID=UPI000E5C607E|nr:30S ribosomal protein S17 [Algihabitans albus]
MPRRVLQGTVVSTKMNKTVTVQVERRVMHPLYKKFIKNSKRYHAHDEENRCQEGETVRIVECAPISKSKRWKVLDGGAQDGGAPDAAAAAAESATKG